MCDYARVINFCIIIIIEDGSTNQCRCSCCWSKQCLVWCNRAFVVGSKDMHGRVYAAQRCQNLIVYSLTSHKDAVVAAFFEHNSLDVSLTTLLACCCWCHPVMGKSQIKSHSGITNHLTKRFKSLCQTTKSNHMKWNQIQIKSHVSKSNHMYSNQIITSDSIMI